ncbi:hypothetical protein SLS56_011935 [Neofusicoccum ribis]|uniref:Uncharacterized protein n=1 Tax=Neofusicoccum ribis TaxID=45134 RepID=A0ABR3SA84_9PEZI
MASDASTNSYKFEDDYIKINADPTISSINLGWNHADLQNDSQESQGKMNGSSSKLVVSYLGGDIRPRTFKASGPSYTFPSDAHVTITGGGVNEGFVTATDGNQAVHWKRV